MAAGYRMIYFFFFEVGIRYDELQSAYRMTFNFNKDVNRVLNLFESLPSVR